jgi:hypothetical protein
MNWKEQLMARGLGIQTRHKELIFDFISKEIIEKLIADIPNSKFDLSDITSLEDIKQQLRDKWL